MTKSISKIYPKDCFNKVCSYIFFCIVLHSIIMIIQFFEPEFKDLIYGIVTDGQFRSSFEYDFRMGGLSGTSGGSVLSAVQSLGILIVPFIINKFFSWNTLLKIVLSLLILSSILVCGRTGLWVILFFLPITLCMNARKKYLALLVSFAIIVILYFVLTLYVINREDLDPISLALSRSLDTIKHYLESNTKEDETLIAMYDHIKIPSDPGVLIFGDTDHVHNQSFGRILDSDNGYVRAIWGFGIFGMIAYSYPLVYIFSISRKKKNVLVSSNILYVFTILMLILNIKENFLYTRMFWSIYVIFLSVFEIDRAALDRRPR